MMPAGRPRKTPEERSESFEAEQETALRAVIQEVLEQRPVRMGDTVLYAPPRLIHRAPDHQRPAIVTRVIGDGRIDLTWFPRPSDPNGVAGQSAVTVPAVPEGDGPGMYRKLE